MIVFILLHVSFMVTYSSDRKRKNSHPCNTHAQKDACYDNPLCFWSTNEAKCNYLDVTCKQVKDEESCRLESECFWSSHSNQCNPQQGIAQDVKENCSSYLEKVDCFEDTRCFWHPPQQACASLEQKIAQHHGSGVFKGSMYAQVQTSMTQLPQASSSPPSQIEQPTENVPPPPALETTSTLSPPPPATTSTQFSSTKRITTSHEPMPPARWNQPWTTTSMQYKTIFPYTSSTSTHMPRGCQMILGAKMLTHGLPTNYFNNKLVSLYSWDSGSRMWLCKVGNTDKLMVVKPENLICMADAPSTTTTPPFVQQKCSDFNNHMLCLRLHSCIWMNNQCADSRDLYPASAQAFPPTNTNPYPNTGGFPSGGSNFPQHFGFPTGPNPNKARVHDCEKIRNEAECESSISQKGFNCRWKPSYGGRGECERMKNGEPDCEHIMDPQECDKSTQQGLPCIWKTFGGSVHHGECEVASHRENFGSIPMEPMEDMGHSMSCEDSYREQECKRTSYRGVPCVWRPYQPGHGGGKCERREEGCEHIYDPTECNASSENGASCYWQKYQFGHGGKCQVQENENHFGQITCEHIRNPAECKRSAFNGKPCQWKVGFGSGKCNTGDSGKYSPYRHNGGPQSKCESIHRRNQCQDRFYKGFPCRWRTAAELHKPFGDCRHQDCEDFRGEKQCKHYSNRCFWDFYERKCENAKGPKGLKRTPKIVFEGAHGARLPAFCLLMFVFSCASRCLFRWKEEQSISIIPLALEDPAPTLEYNLLVEESDTSTIIAGKANFSKSIPRNAINA